MKMNKKKIKKSITLSVDTIKYIEDNFDTTIFSLAVENIIDEHKKFTEINNTLSEKNYKQYEELKLNQQIILDMLNSFYLEKELNIQFYGNKNENPSSNYLESFKYQNEIREKELTKMRNKRLKE